MLLTVLFAVAALNVTTNVPPLMTCADGTKVDSVATWEKVRRPELLRTFLTNVYGVRPVERPDDLRFEVVREDREAFGGRAIRKFVRISFSGVGGKTNFIAQAVFPKAAASRPVPCFVSCNFGSCLNQDGSLNESGERKYWNPKDLIDRGYATVAFFMDDIVRDLSNETGYWKEENKVHGRYAQRFNREGVYAVLEKFESRNDESWGTISAWAWGASRVMDWIEMEPMIDAKHVAVAGHSRGGKTALVAGITDTRFAMVCSNDSGCTGAKLHHMDLPASEHIEWINASFPDWFCGNYKRFAGREMELPFDQHQWLALVAPRLLAVGSGSLDRWAGPPGEFEAARLASPAWELYGKRGLVAPEGFPSVNTACQAGTVSYHLREGKHYFDAWDWARYMDFADRNGWRAPALMETYDGQPVDSVAKWEKTRRPEIRERILTRMYGRRPRTAEKPSVAFANAEPEKEMLDGQALRKRIRITSKGPYGDHSFTVTAFIPKSAKPVGSFVFICNRDPKKNLDPERKVKSEFWPVEEIVARGYAAIAFFNGDVAPETYNPATAFLSGVFPCFERPADRDDFSWGTLSAWGWGASRVMDWIETEPMLDATHVAVVGHSRGGKTALLAGATDERFALTCVNDSGCGGAKLAAMDLPESEYYAIFLQSRVTYWFCGNFQRMCMNHDRPPPDLAAWKGRWDDLLSPLGFDQHQWAALVAPRLLAIGSASEDVGAGPRGEFETARLASPAWEFYGKKGLVSPDGFPSVGTALCEGSVSYHLREGKHDLTKWDWARYMDFADQHGWGK